MPSLHELVMGVVYAHDRKKTTPTQLVIASTFVHHVSQPPLVKARLDLHAESPGCLSQTLTGENSSFSHTVLLVYPAHCLRE